MSAEMPDDSPTMLGDVTIALSDARLEKKPLQFRVEKSDSASSDANLHRHQDIEELRQRLSATGSAVLFKWSSFPIELPPLLRDLPQINIADALFRAPRFDELEQVNNTISLFQHYEQNVSYCVQRY